MRCIVVDDEPLAREGMELLIDETAGLEHLASFEDALKASAYLKDNEVDLMFLDIQMPGLTGIDFLKMMDLNPLVILCTAYSEYAVEAYELEVVDYLMKPINQERFGKAIQKAQEINEAHNSRSSHQIESAAEDYFYIRADRQYVKLFFKDIEFIRGMKDYVMIRTESDKIMTAMNIKTIYEKLPPSRFFRVSKSYIVNTEKMSNISSDLVMLGSHEIPLGKTYKKEFVEKFVRPKLFGK